MKKVLFALALTVIFNAGANAQSTETWSQITSVSTIAGRWTGSLDMEIPQNDATGIPNSIMKFSISLEYALSNKDVIIEMQIDFNQFLNDWVKVPAMVELKVTKDQLWNMLKELLKNFLEEDVSFDNNYKLSYFMNFEADSFSGSDNFRINQDRTKIKLIFDDPVSFGLGDEGFTEMILTKTGKLL